MTSKEEWGEIGREQGEAAGSGEIVFQEEATGTWVEPFATNHSIHDGIYTLIRRHSDEFPTDEHHAAWLTGVLTGINSSGAWMGSLCVVDGVSFGLKPGKMTCVFVTPHPSTMGFKAD